MSESESDPHRPTPAAPPRPGCKAKGERPPPQEVPTLPLPSKWRLAVALLAVLAFLYAMYNFQAARDAEEQAAPPPPPAGDAPR